MARATRPADRIELLDALRGFALFGILLANILTFSGWVFMTPAQQLALAGSDAVEWQYRFHHLLIDGKFYTIFSLLFGTGFALQIARLSARGEQGLAIYRRRVLILLVIGLLHSWFIWDGDILTVYALLGLLLPLFYKWGERALLIAAAILIFVIPPVGMALFSYLGWAPHDIFYGLGETIAASLGADPSQEAAIAWLRRDDFMGWFAWVISGTPFSIGIRLETWRFPKVLGVMLIGLVIGRRLAAGTLIDRPQLLRRVMGFGLLLGLPASALYAAIPELGQSAWPSLLGTVPLALAYAAGFVLLWPRARGVLQHLVPVGRMALTNYLAHSVLGVVIFYGVGFGLVGHLQPAAIYAVAIMIFAVQMIVSRWWLAHHEQGPMERLWRNLTYRTSPVKHPIPAP